MTGRVRGWLRAAGSTRSLLKERRAWRGVILHDARLPNVPPALALPLVCGPVKGALRCPPSLTILLMNDARSLTLLEQGLRYAGIDRYTVVRPRVNGAWRDSIKITAVLNYLESGACQTEYVLYADSRDALLRDDPREAVALLDDSDCDCLFSATRFDLGYECMPEVKAWALDNGRQRGFAGRFINAGVFIGRVAFLRELFSAAVDYITPDELTRAEFRRHLQQGTLCEALPDFPRGVGTDQQIIRWLQPRYHPRLQVDYAGRLAVPR